ncbi:hypothetical protein B566_EDAN013716 [Ephemera danica]|nr:hypothetical protein B566_EDAN013716 [Ephemera danica]
MFSNVGIIGLVVGYTICGAFMFKAIEGGDASDERKALIFEVVEFRNNTAEQLWKITNELSFAESEDEWKTKVLHELVQYQRQVIKAQGLGYDGNDDVGEESSSSKQWSFSGAFLYSLTVITTIGSTYATISISLAVCTVYGRY